jgi:hypothetical protein
MYRPPHGVHVPPVQRRNARPRGAMPQGARPQVVRSRGGRGGRARRGSGRDQYDFRPHGVDFSPTVLADHVFPHVVPAFLKWDMACLVFFLTLFQGK